MKPETMMIDDVRYVREDSINVEKEIIAVVDGESIARAMIGQPVIVRSRNEGINAGILVAADATGVQLKDCRRIYYHKPADKKLSWYEGVAQSGLSKDSKTSGTVACKFIIEPYSLTQCTAVAVASIMEHTPNAQR